VIDAGAPRNRFAAAAHGVFGHDGAEPRAMIGTARKQLERYPTVRFVDGKAMEARAAGRGFAIRLNEGETLEGERLVLAFGVSDVLPQLPGLAERWGASVLHCPYCHGFEYADRPLGVLYRNERSAEQALLIAEWGLTTLYLNGNNAPDEAALARLAVRGVVVEPASIVALEGEGKALSSAILADGRRSAVEALYLFPTVRLNSGIAEQLGCAIDVSPFGPVIHTSAMKETTIPGVFAAGDAAREAHNASWAAADGVTAGAATHRSLVFSR
jgi:thioredoxin reductase